MPHLFRCLVAAASLTAFGAVSASAQMNLGNRQNNNQPIEIASDTLEVFQDRQLAIFKGNVDVVQGDMRLRSDELYVHYRDNNQGNAQASQQRGQQAGQQAGQQRANAPAQQRPAQQQAGGGGSGAGAGGPDMGAITRIEAKGKVFISSPTEQAQGTYADYDVQKKLVVMRGDVLLTQKGSVLRCDVVTMQQDTGKSTCTAPAGGRVRGVFQSGAQ
ncbi:LptA/OstA family protein [Ferrovibrio sp.]|uniref:LptA/OstA family protein n=1 Tax=Ferrovibrio sp. TaxID=1917215 RepID=UPI0025BA06BE|nr:LptA/OstA family protein [Ferrovibrio sp.]MBX3454563.1 hypothetical protein [Ferrovibrio sp.]